MGLCSVIMYGKWIHAIDPNYISLSLSLSLSLPLQQQFFISSLIEDDVINGVAEALRLRIARAHREGKTFRVIVVMPLLPSFEGEWRRRSEERRAMVGVTGRVSRVST